MTDIKKPSAKKKTATATETMVAALVPVAAAVSPERVKEQVRIAALEALHVARIEEDASRVRIDGLRVTALTTAIDQLRAAGIIALEIKEALGGIIDAAAEAGDLSDASVRPYKSGIGFAIDACVPWNSSLASTEGRVKALLAAGRDIPKSLQAAADKLAEKEDAKQDAKRDAKSSKTSVASRETVIAYLAKALADARTLGMIQACDILDAIDAIDPTYTEPKDAE